MQTADQANILVVDDNPDNLFALRRMLQPLGQNVVEARSGEAALRALLQDEFAVILLDVRMPGMDGFETAQEIKQRDRTRHVPIIFLTAADYTESQALQGYSSGGVDYLVKPFEPWLLTSKVAVFLDLWLERRRAEDLSRRLSESELRRRHALELNDDVVQGLAVALYAFEVGDEAMAKRAVESTLDSAKRLVAGLLESGTGGRIEPGDLVREESGDPEP